MASEVLAHLLEPAAWRTALADGVVRPPSLESGGFDLAARAGCDLVVLEAAADDWPHAWYSRRGFDTLGSVWAADRPA